jgi:hypothetical protein
LLVVLLHVVLNSAGEQMAWTLLTLRLTYSKIASKSAPTPSNGLKPLSRVSHRQQGAKTQPRPRVTLGPRWRQYGTRHRRRSQMRENREAPSVDGASGVGVITREHAIAAARNSVRNHGYAVAVHGSVGRDVDLVAVPWQDTALDAMQIAGIIAAAIPGKIIGEPEQKPHGRIGFTIYPNWTYGFDTWYVDLSVMPRTPAVRNEAPPQEEQNG